MYICMYVCTYVRICVCTYVLGLCNNGKTYISIIHYKIILINKYVIEHYAYFLGFLIIQNCSVY